MVWAVYVCHRAAIRGSWEESSSPRSSWEARGWWCRPLALAFITQAGQTSSHTRGAHHPPPHSSVTIIADLKHGNNGDTCLFEASFGLFRYPTIGRLWEIPSKWACWEMSAINSACQLVVAGSDVALGSCHEAGWWPRGEPLYCSDHWETPVWRVHRNQLLNYTQDDLLYDACTYQLLNWIQDYRLNARLATFAKERLADHSILQCRWAQFWPLWASLRRYIFPVGVCTSSFACPGFPLNYSSRYWPLCVWL